jgi:hypothetical protein
MLASGCCICIRVAGPQYEVLELPHPFERQLFLIIRDDTVVRADPERKLMQCFARERCG